LTARIYYTDAYAAVFEAVITRAFVHDGRPAVTLDRTAFYPTSGGQPFDIGTLGSVRVVDVVDLEDEGIAHVLDQPLAEGVRVQATIDWPRRFDHMQQHTGQHVLSAAFDHLFKNRTMSFHMGAEVSTIDLAVEASASAIAAAEEEANRVVWEDRPVSIRFASADEAATLNLRKEPVRGGTLRLVDVAAFDLSACGGTHVGRTGAIGIIAVTAAERFRGGTRLTFVCGGRTLRMFRTYRDAITGSIRSLSVLPEELPAAVERVQSEAKDLRRTIKTLQEALAGHEAARLVAEATIINGVHVVAAALEGWDAAGLKAIAAAAAARESVAVALFSATSPAVAVIARSRNVNVDAQAVLKALVAKHGGRGGGKPDLAQGGGLDGDVEKIVDSARNLLCGAGLPSHEASADRRSLG
jgi:alanyl-tRNA synthetase